MRRSLALATLLLALPAPAAAASAGGTTYPPASSGGGTSYGAASTSRPTVARFGVPARVRAPRLPAVRFRIDEAGAGAVRARIAVLPLGAGPPQSIALGRVATGRTVSVEWPRGTKLPKGRYLVRLHAVDDAGHTLVRPAYASGRATLTVLAARKKKVAKKPAPAAAKPAPSAPVPGPSAPTTPVTPSSPTTAGVFPVAAAHTYGDGFGVGRVGHTHQGVDVLAAEGAPV